MDEQEIQAHNIETDVREPLTGKKDKNRISNSWIPLVRLAVVRNMSIAFVMALSLIAILYIVFAQPWHEAPKSISPPIESVAPSTAPPTHASAPDKSGLRLPPEVEPLNRPETIAPTPEIMALAKPYLQPMCDGDEMYFDCTQTNIATVETTENYTHQIVTMGKDQYYHLYTFKLACGHTIMTTPDPYRNVMYKYPEKLVDKYSNMTCSKCEALNKILKSEGTGE